MIRCRSQYHRYQIILHFEMEHRIIDTKLFYILNYIGIGNEIINHCGQNFGSDGYSNFTLRVFYSRHVEQSHIDGGKLRQNTSNIIIQLDSNKLRYLASSLRKYQGHKCDGMYRHFFATQVCRTYCCMP